MHSNTDKTQKSRGKSPVAIEKQENDKSTFQLIDNRPEALIQRKLQNIANKNSQAKKNAQLKTIANNHLKQPLQAMWNGEDEKSTDDSKKSPPPADPSPVAAALPLVVPPATQALDGHPIIVKAKEIIAGLKAKGKKVNPNIVKQRLGDDVERYFQTHPPADVHIDYRNIEVQRKGEGDKPGTKVQDAELDGISLNPLTIISIKGAKKAQKQRRDFEMWNNIKATVQAGGNILVGGNPHPELNDLFIQDGDPAWQPLSFDYTPEGEAVWGEVDRLANE